jgi:ABC-2 type transport system permease protein
MRAGLHTVIAIAAAEWRCWQRSRLAMGAVALLAVLLLATTALSTLRLQAEAAERAHHQGQAEAAFRAQPDRHPHRMVHYGHYVFRTPAPLALFDPGLDAVTGQSLFLEGHRQNTAAFAGAAASADLGGLGSLSPAWVYQVLAPLLLVLLGHGALVREREAGTLATLLAQGLGGRPLLAGKALALAAAVAVLLLPLAAAAGIAVAQGESPAAAGALLVLYGAYLLLWAWLALVASALWRQRGAVLAALASLWIALTLVLPALAVSATAAAGTGGVQAGKIETDLAMLKELRRLGDGHNANDPAFARLRAELLAQHGVQRVEDLPLNLRGVVAEHSERQLTETLNAWAQRQQLGEQRLAERLARHGWFTPVLALAGASRAVAGTDLRHHHRFLQEAEALRYGFVQGLNRVHAQQLAYADDIRRSSDPEAERRTRVAASTWQLLDRFRFEPDAAAARIAQAAPQGLMLLPWLVGLLAALAVLGRRLQP